MSSSPPNTSPSASPKAKASSPAISPVALQPPSALMPPSPPHTNQSITTHVVSVATGASATSPSAITTATPVSAGATLSVPRAISGSGKPSRQMSNPKDQPAASSSPSGLPSGLPANLNLSPTSGAGPGMTRLGSRSPSSIPSSPTSIHSSSSAIFERDIEPLGLPSLSLPLATSHSSSKSGHPLRTSTNGPAPTDPHRIPRSKTTEALELTVPSVLDSAVSALAEDAGASITVLSPAIATGHPLAQSYSAAQSPMSIHSPASQFGSTIQAQAGSPSPPTMSLLLQGMGMSGLVSASASVSGAAASASGFASPNASSRAPSPARSASPPVINTISETAVPAPSTGSGAGSGPGSPQARETLSFTSSPHKRPTLGVSGATSGQGIPSPNMKASSRLSFISYTDLLTSAPIASQTLSSVLHPGQNEPPTHLVVVDSDGAPVGTGLTPNTSTGNLLLTGHNGIGGIGSLNINPTDKIDVDSLGTVGLSSTGEWGREGLGGGLEERLERLWQAEKDLNERGRVMSTGRGSRPVSMAYGSGDVPTFTSASPAASAAP